MSRLIDADEMRENLLWCKSQSSRYDNYWDDVIERLDVQPTIDAAPVKHGRWIVEMPNEYTKITKCSICGESAPFICVSGDHYGRYMHGETQMTKYCPNCGAKMDL